MQKLKILILGKLPPPYFGPAIATDIILNSALKDSFNLIHFDTRLNESVEGIGRFKPDKLFKILRQYFRFAWMLSKSPFDLILVPISQSTGGFMKDSFFIVLAKLFGNKTVIQLRGSNLRNWLKSAPLPVRAYAERIIKMNNAAIVLGNSLKYIFQGLIPENKIFVAPNGADYPELIYIRDSNIVQAKEAINVLYLANFLPSKGIVDVVKAAKLVNNNISLTAAGSWEGSEFMKICMDLANDSEYIDFFPPADYNQKIKYLTEADIFVFTPREPEGHPWVIVEAMAAGLPIISTDQGAIIESVIDGVNGFIVEPNKPEQIADKIKVLVEDKELRIKMGNQSRKLYMENFTEEKMIRNLSSIFNTVINQP